MYMYNHVHTFKVEDLFKCIRGVTRLGLTRVSIGGSPSKRPTW